MHHTLKLLIPFSIIPQSLGHLSCVPKICSNRIPGYHPMVDRCKLNLPTMLKTDSVYCQDIAGQATCHCPEGYFSKNVMGRYVTCSVCRQNDYNVPETLTKIIQQASYDEDYIKLEYDVDNEAIKITELQAGYSGVIFHTPDNGPNSKITNYTFVNTAGSSEIHTGWTPHNTMTPNSLVRNPGDKSFLDQYVIVESDWKLVETDSGDAKDANGNTGWSSIDVRKKSSKTSILRFERVTNSIFDPKFVENVDFAVRKRYQLDFRPKIR